VEEAADRCSSFSEVVVEPDRVSGLFDVDRDPSFAQKIEGRGAGPQAELLAAAQDDDPASMFDELPDVCRLDAGVVPRSGLVPVPRPSAPRPEFEVLPRAQPVDVHPAP